MCDEPIRETVECDAAQGRLVGIENAAVFPSDPEKVNSLCSQGRKKRCKWSKVKGSFMPVLELHQFSKVLAALWCHPNCLVLLLKQHQRSHRRLVVCASELGNPIVDIAWTCSLQVFGLLSEHQDWTS